MNCHACGRAAEPTPGHPTGVREECEGCGADLHVCRNCAHFDPGVYNQCREISAERVLDKERANHCDQFAPGAGEGGGEERDAASRARAALDRLFEK